MTLRIIAIIILLFSILFLPFWVSAIGGILYFPMFLEAVLIFLISDLMFGIPEARFANYVFFSSTIIFVLLIILELLKNKIRFYQK
jgi:hypothetical protein